MYRESLREVLLNRPGECTGKDLGKFFSTGLENVRESLREVLR